jgi:hypothetical protein
MNKNNPQFPDLSFPGTLGRCCLHTIEEVEQIHGLS